MMYLMIANTDVSAFLTEESFVCMTEPVYADSYINIYGEHIRQKTGEMTTIKAVLTDVDDTTARTLRTALSGNTVSVGYISPQEQTAQMICEKAVFSVERDRECVYWTISIILGGNVRSCL